MPDIFLYSNMSTEIIPPIVTLVVFILTTAFTAYKAYRHGTWMFWSLILSGICKFSLSPVWCNIAQSY